MSISLIPRELPREAPSVTTPGAGLRHVRCFSGRRVIAQVRGGNLYVHRYDDALPDAIAQTLTLVTGGVTGCGLQARPCGALDLFYCKGGAVYHRLSRDEGAAWGTAAAVGALSGYSLVEFAHDGSRGLLAVWNGSWGCCSGSVAADGLTWSWGSPAAMTGTAARKWGTLRMLPDGAWLFAWTDSGGTPRVSRCLKIDSVGAGSWAILATATGYAQAALHLGQSLVSVPVYHTAGARWDVMAGTIAADANLALAGPGTVGLADAAMGSLLVRSDGAWEMALVPSGGGDPVIRRCPALLATGAGTWG